MFGFSLTKILFTIAAVAAVWYGFKAFSRYQERQEQLSRERARDERMAARKPGASGQAASDKASGGGVSSGAEEMVACPECGAYVPEAGAPNCGKSACPYPG